MHHTQDMHRQLSGPTHAWHAMSRWWAAATAQDMPQVFTAVRSIESSQSSANKTAALPAISRKLALCCKSLIMA